MGACKEVHAARDLLAQVASYPHPKMERLEQEVLKHFNQASAGAWWPPPRWWGHGEATSPQVLHAGRGAGRP